MLVKAAWISIRSPGPLKAFSERVRARRGAQIAAVAVARKLVVLCWHLLTKDQDYAFARPSLTRQKTRRLELLAGAPPLARRHGGPPVSPSSSQRAAERELQQQAELAYRRLIDDWRTTAPKGGVGATPGRASNKPSKGKAAGHKPLTPALRYVNHPHHDKSFHSETPAATPPPILAPAPRHARRHRKRPVPSTDHMHTPPGAVRPLGRPSATSSVKQHPQQSRRNVRTNP